MNLKFILNDDVKVGRTSDERDREEDRRTSTDKQQKMETLMN